MSKVICIMGESGSGKTTSMRNLDPKTTYYIDADKKGLSWKGWRKQYNKENKNYLVCDDANIVRQYIKRIAEACSGVKVTRCAGVRKKVMTNGWILQRVSGIWYVKRIHTGMI